LESVGVHQELTTLYILKYNRIIDRDNKIVVESVCYMIHAKNVSLRFWGQAIQKIVYIFKFLEVIILSIYLRNLESK
jgi:hypothetical protein